MEVIIMKSREDIVNAVNEGDIDMIQEYVTQAQADQTQINEQDDEGNTLLHVATEHLRATYAITRKIPRNVTDVILLLAKHVNRRKRNAAKKLAVHILLESEATFNEDCMIPVLDALLTEEYIGEEYCVEGRYILHDAAKKKF